jgi:chromosome segregation ATPase
MSDVLELGNRITVALDRIRRGVEAQGKADAAETSLYDALQAERAQNSALSDQIRQLQNAEGGQAGDLARRVETQQAQLQAMDGHLQRLRAATQQLRDLNGQLRHALTAGLAPELIDSALAAEVEALQALRAADAAEIDAILAELKPLIEDAAHAAG